VDDERLRSTLAEARNSLGAVLINLRRYDEALAALRPAAQELTYTSQHLVLGNIGLALLRKGSLEEAAQSLERAVALQPQFCVGFTRLGGAAPAAVRRGPGGRGPRPRAVDPAARLQRDSRSLAPSRPRAHPAPAR
jgi:tetratricopeptide (TPR) repeat protein